MFSKVVSRVIIQALICICSSSSMIRGCAEPFLESSQNSNSNTTSIVVAGTFDVHFDFIVKFHNFKMEPEFDDCIK